MRFIPYSALNTRWLFAQRGAVILRPSGEMGLYYPDGGTARGYQPEGDGPLFYDEGLTKQAAPPYVED